ncbi:putative F-box/FBD/LRR-repeat protein At4g03220 [Rhododendron vialii]|uniref:putative F-box/FBD/LRR-repeat protein At4g03220 n=1 Tax=Rhododendron vialii TaxID=182163 RepID=UPI00265DAD28|nr:putative F-box/FBD/LRR-repeat protein At4g03220 [Rhododendron vialii]
METADEGEKHHGKSLTAEAEINKMKERNTSDRISDLPVELLHHIFSFLPIQSLTQTTLLSKHWNQLCLWRSQPLLDFSSLTPKSMKLISTVLSRRQPNSNITTFRLSTVSGYFSGVVRTCFRVVISLSSMSDLSINCPCLEYLKLDGLELKGLDVSGRRLLEFGLRRCFKDINSSAKIFAPSLRSFYWEDICVAVEFATGSFGCLDKGSVYFLGTSQNAATLQSTSNFLSAFSFTRSICLGSLVIEFLGYIGFAGGLPCSFNNLRTLDLQTDLRRAEIEGILYLLRTSPILQTITIDSPSRCEPEDVLWDDEQYWESQNQTFKSLEHHLKVVRIHIQNTKALTRVHKSTINLVQFCLRHGRVLQEMTLTL